MGNPDAARRDWVRPTLPSVRILSRRRDLALPLVVLAVQLVGAAVTNSHPSLLHPVHLHQGHLSALDWGLLAVGPAALVARRQHPVAVLWVTFGATLVSAFSFAYLSLMVAIFVATMTGHRWSAWLALMLEFVYVIWLRPLAYSQATPSLGFALGLAGWLVVFVIATEVTRMRRERVVETKAARHIDQRRRESEERLRVARDLHDVIGHNISLINVQASMGLDLLRTQPEQAQAALSAIKAASKEALEELRAMLTTLRRDEEVAPRSPAPGLQRLPELVELTKAAGLKVQVEVVGKAPHLASAVDLAAYRIIQESLTNVARHAGRAQAIVRVTYNDRGVLVEVADDGKAPSNGARAISTGSGIGGMRERASALGGELSAGFRPDGGFMVSARLPYSPSP